MSGKKLVISVAILVLGWGSFCECQVFFGGECLDIKPLDDFDIQKLLGTWYEYKKYPSDIDKGSRCGKHIYDRGSDGNVTVLRTRYNMFSKSFIDQKGIISDYNKGKLYLDFHDAAAAARNRFMVIDTDYTSFAVYYSCIQINARYHMKMIEILTRDAQPNSETVKKSIQILAKNGLDTSYLRDIDQTDCVRRTGVIEKVMEYV